MEPDNKDVIILDEFFQQIKKKQIPYDYSLICLGITGSGKSSILNKIAQKPNLFPEGDELDSKTQNIQIYAKVDINKGKTCLLIDTPGFYDSNSKDQANVKEFFMNMTQLDKGVTYFVYPINLLSISTRIDATFIESMKKIKFLFGDEVFQHMKIIFTHFDEYSNMKKNDLKEIEKNIVNMKETIIKRFYSHDIDFNKENFLIYNHQHDKGGEDLINLMEVLDKKPNYLPEIIKNFISLNEKDRTEKEIKEIIISINNKIIQHNAVINDKTYNKRLRDIDQREVKLRKEEKELELKEQKAKEETDKFLRKEQKELELKFQKAKEENDKINEIKKKNIDEIVLKKVNEKLEEKKCEEKKFAENKSVGANYYSLIPYQKERKIIDEKREEMRQNSRANDKKLSTESKVLATTLTTGVAAAIGGGAAYYSTTVASTALIMKTCTTLGCTAGPAGALVGAGFGAAIAGVGWLISKLW